MRHFLKAFELHQKLYTYSNHITSIVLSLSQNVVTDWKWKLDTGQQIILSIKAIEVN